MKYVEYGKEHADAIVLLHGGGLNWWNWRDTAEELQKDFHVILPVLDGHAGSSRPFTGIGDNSREIIEWMDGNLGEKPLLIGGLSLGGQILLEMLAQRKDLCRYALVESASVIPSGLTSALIGPAVSGSYFLIRSRRFSRLQFRSLHMQPGLFEDYWRDTRGISRADMAAFMKSSTYYAFPEACTATDAKVHIYAGDRETRGILRSARLMHSRIPASVLTVLPGLYHGEFSMNHVSEYVSAVRDITGRS